MILHGAYHPCLRYLVRVNPPLKKHELNIVSGLKKPIEKWAFYPDLSILHDRFLEQSQSQLWPHQISRSSWITKGPLPAHLSK